MTYPQNFEEKIDFNDIRKLLQEKCLSTLGEEKVTQLQFHKEHALLNELHAHTKEFLSIMNEEEDFPDQYFFDVREAVKRIRIEGTYLDEQELFDLKRSLETIAGIVRFLNRDSDAEPTTETGRMEITCSRYPALSRLAQGVSVFPQLVKYISEILDPYGKIKDSASPELLRVRRELRETESSISRILNGILKNARTEGLVDKDVTPTMRDGRLVIPVVPAMKRKIKGIVHDESATGKTVFIEPAEVV